MSLYTYASAPQGQPYPLGNKVPAPPASPAKAAYTGENEVGVFNHALKKGEYFPGQDMTQPGFDSYSLSRPPLYGWTGSIPDPSQPPLHTALPNWGGGRVIPRLG